MNSIIHQYLDTQAPFLIISYFDICQDFLVAGDRNSIQTSLRQKRGCPGLHSWWLKSPDDSGSRGDHQISVLFPLSREAPFLVVARWLFSSCRLTSQPAQQKELFVPNRLNESSKIIWLWLILVTCPSLWPEGWHKRLGTCWTSYLNQRHRVPSKGERGSWCCQEEG